MQWYDDFPAGGLLSEAEERHLALAVDVLQPAVSLQLPTGAREMRPRNAYAYGQISRRSLDGVF